MGHMWDGVYSKKGKGENLSTWHRLYPNEKILKRNFQQELQEISFENYPEITFVTLFCGRFHTLAPYFWQLGNFDYDKKKINLIFYCSSHNEYFNKMLRSAAKKIAKEYASMRLVFDKTIPPSVLAFSEKGKDLKTHLDNIPKLYQKAFTMVKTRYFFSFEDDQINPSHTVKRFLKVIRLDNVASICGIAFDRHVARDKAVAFDFYISPSGQRIVGKFVDDRKFCLTPVGSSGFGATIFDSERIKDIDYTHILAEAPEISGADVTFGYQVNKLGGVILHDWDVRSYHVDSEGVIC